MVKTLRGSGGESPIYPSDNVEQDTPRADIHGKRTQEGVGATPQHLSVITPLSFMLAGLVEPAWQNGGSNQVIVPSGDRTKPVLCTNGAM